MLGQIGLLTLAMQVPTGAEEKQLFAEFQTLETKLLAAEQQKQAEVLEQLVNPEFAWSISFRGEQNHVMSRSEWMKGVKHYDVKEFGIGLLTAQRFGDGVVVQFRLKANAQAAPTVDISGEYVMTDLWLRKGGSWQIARRFVATAVPKPGGK